jgi:hypothetical protein
MNQSQGKFSSSILYQTRKWEMVSRRVKSGREEDDASRQERAKAWGRGRGVEIAIGPRTKIESEMLRMVGNKRWLGIG